MDQDLTLIPNNRDKKKKDLLDHYQSSLSFFYNQTNEVQNLSFQNYLSINITSLLLSNFRVDSLFSLVIESLHSR